MRSSYLALFSGLLTIILPVFPSSASPVTGIIQLPPTFTYKPQFEAPGFWRGLRNEVLKVKYSLADPRQEMVVTLVGGGLPQMQQKKPYLIMKDAKFEPTVLPVPVGMQLTFINNDSSHHLLEPVGKSKFMQVMRISPRATGRYTFKQPGSYTIKCSEVPHMRATIVVVKAPQFTVPDSSGTFRFTGIPDGGGYVLKVWYRGKWVHEQPLGVKGKTTVHVQLSTQVGKE